MSMALKIMIKRAVVYRCGYRGTSYSWRYRWRAYPWIPIIGAMLQRLAVINWHGTAVIPSEGLIKLVYQSGLADKPSASKGVSVVVFRHNVKDIMGSLAWDGDIGDIQRLRKIMLPSTEIGELLPKLRGVDVLGRQRGLRSDCCFPAELTGVLARLRWTQAIRQSNQHRQARERQTWILRHGSFLGGHARCGRNLGGRYASRDLAP